LALGLGQCCQLNFHRLRCLGFLALSIRARVLVRRIHRGGSASSMWSGVVPVLCSQPRSNLITDQAADPAFPAPWIRRHLAFECREEDRDYDRLRQVLRFLTPPATEPAKRSSELAIYQLFKLDKLCRDLASTTRKLPACLGREGLSDAEPWPGSGRPRPSFMPHGRSRPVVTYPPCVLGIGALYALSPSICEEVFRRTARSSSQSLAVHGGSPQETPRQGSTRRGPRAVEPSVPRVPEGCRIPFLFPGPAYESLHGTRGDDIVAELTARDWPRPGRRPRRPRRRQPAATTAGRLYFGHLAGTPPYGPTARGWVDPPGAPKSSAYPPRSPLPSPPGALQGVPASFVFSQEFRFFRRDST
jgi:hypothetical protein